MCFLAGTVLYCSYRAVRYRAVQCAAQTQPLVLRCVLLRQDNTKKQCAPSAAISLPFLKAVTARPTTPVSSSQSSNLILHVGAPPGCDTAFHTQLQWKKWHMCNMGETVGGNPLISKTKPRRHMLCKGIRHDLHGIMSKQLLCSLRLSGRHVMLRKGSSLVFMKKKAHQRVFSPSASLPCDGLIARVVLATALPMRVWTTCVCA